MKTIITIITLFAFVSFSSCQKENNDIPEENKNILLDEKSAQLIEADNAFGLEVFQKIRNESEEET